MMQSNTCRGMVMSTPEFKLFPFFPGFLTREEMHEDIEYVIFGGMAEAVGMEVEEYQLENGLWDWKFVDKKESK